MYLFGKSFAQASANFVFFGLAACGQANSQGSYLLQSSSSLQSTDKIIGENDLVAVVRDGANLPADYRSMVDAFGFIQMGCTATHIGRGLVLTAGHCFKAPGFRVNHVACPGVTVKWGLRTDKPEYLLSNCVEVVAAEYSAFRDYAIFRVDVAPDAFVEVDASARSLNETKVTMFGYPQARPLEWSQFCTVQSASNAGRGEFMFTHQCDTEPGNSGSTVISDVSKKVIGIHDGGLVPWNYGTFLADTPLLEILSSKQ